MLLHLYYLTYSLHMYMYPNMKTLITWNSYRYLKIGILHLSYLACYRNAYPKLTKLYKMSQSLKNKIIQRLFSFKYVMKKEACKTSGFLFYCYAPRSKSVKSPIVNVLHFTCMKEKAWTGKTEIGISDKPYGKDL
jgi:hypothetical protein